MWLFRLRLVTACVAGMGALSWLIVGESSPFHEFFLYHVAVPNVWRLVHFPALILSIIASGNIHQGGEVVFVIGFIVQWAIVGLVLSLLIEKRFRRPGPRRARTPIA